MKCYNKECDDYDERQDNNCTGVYFQVNRRICDKSIDIDTGIINEQNLYKKALELACDDVSTLSGTCPYILSINYRPFDFCHRCNNYTDSSECWHKFFLNKANEGETLKGGQ